METLQENLKARAAELRQKLLEEGAATVSVFYDGYADSGGIEDIDIKSADGETVKLDEPLRRQLVDLFYDLLEERFSGWENDTGANGSFDWDLQTDTLQHTHNDRIEDYDTTILDGWSGKVSEAEPDSDEEEAADA